MVVSHSGDTSYKTGTSSSNKNSTLPFSKTLLLASFLLLPDIRVQVSGLQELGAGNPKSVHGLSWKLSQLGPGKSNCALLKTR